MTSEFFVDFWEFSESFFLYNSWISSFNKLKKNCFCFLLHRCVICFDIKREGNNFHLFPWQKKHYIYCKSKSGDHKWTNHISNVYCLPWNETNLHNKYIESFHLQSAIIQKKCIKSCSIISKKHFAYINTALSSICVHVCTCMYLIFWIWVWTMAQAIKTFEILIILIVYVYRILNLREKIMSEKI